jgi:hypothetical protein
VGLPGQESRWTSADDKDVSEVVRGLLVSLSLAPDVAIDCSGHRGNWVISVRRGFPGPDGR